MYQAQIERIKTKFTKAQNLDSGLKVFGAKSHKYKIGKCAKNEEIEEFEEKFSLLVTYEFKFLAFALFYCKLLLLFFALFLTFVF